MNEGQADILRRTGEEYYAQILQSLLGLPEANRHVMLAVLIADVAGVRDQLSLPELKEVIGEVKAVILRLQQLKKP